MKKKGILIAAVAAAVLAGGAILSMSITGVFSKYRKQPLQSYSYGRGGDMNGSTYQEYVERFDDTHALVTIRSASWHFQDPAVSEYLVDVRVLDEIKAVFDKYNMQRWDGKKFTRMFIADGASHHYSFDFENGDVGFSSQYYPARYSKKLNEIDAVLEKYMKTKEKQPYLVLPELTEEEQAAVSRPYDGELKVSVYEYSRRYLYYRFSNGTEESVEVPGGYVLKKEGSETPIAEKSAEKAYRLAVGPHHVNEREIPLDARLAPGTYTLEAGGLCCTFTIGEAEE